ncbi:acyl-CoA dehydrogenase family protein [Chryseobacterium sp.]|uniref:acyl-CoA dehydrogenase family protein n=1 Tax=Chryseobacterium sp. TaxID=1871047 RepID=UPI0025BC1E79|nr:acyl-CoA dehydrogenase family protein [Chryseobacterium sp.]
MSTILENIEQESKINRHAYTIAKQLADLFSETAVERDKNGGTAFHERNLLRKSGLLKLLIPKQYGGLESDWISILNIVRLFARVDGSLAHLFGYHHLILATIELYGSPEQFECYSKKTAENNFFWGNALNPLDEGTKIQFKDNQYKINGRKGFSSGSVDSDMLLVSAYDEAGKIWIGVVESGRKGIKINADWNNFGQRQTDSGTVEFNNLILEEHEILKTPGPMGNLRSTLRSALAQLILSNIYLGMAEGALKEAKNYTSAQTRPWINSGAKTSQKDPYILANYGEMWLSIQASKLLLDQAMDDFQQSWDAGESITENQRGKCALSIAAAKVQAARTGLFIANKMFEVTGARATNGAARLDRFWRNIRTHTLHDPIDYKIKELGDWALNDQLPQPGFYS